MKKKQTNKKKGFWHRQVVLYTNSWHSTMKWKTLLPIGFDILLVILLFLSYTANSIAWGAVAQPLAPTIKAIQSLESKNAPLEQKRAFIESEKPDVNSALLKGWSITTLLILIFVVLYALIKTKVWSLVQGERFLRKRFLKNLIFTFISAVLLIGLFFSLLPLTTPFNVAIIVTMVLFFVMMVAPLLYSSSSWRFSGSTITKYLLILLAQIITWLIIITLIGLAAFITPWVYIVLFPIWLFIFLAWGRNYVNLFVRGGQRA